MKAIAYSFIIWFWNGFDELFCSLIAFILVDLIIRLFLVLSEKKLHSHINYKLFFYIITIFLLVGIGNICDKNLITSKGFFRTIVIKSYIIDEGKNIIKNIRKLNLPFPDKFKNLFI